MVVGLLGSVGVAVYQNWLLKYKSTKIELARQAGIGNFIVENAIFNATKSLRAAQRAMQPALDHKPSSSQALQILQSADSETHAYSNSNYGGFLLYIDPQGLLQASTDLAPHDNINLADQPYFLRLSQKTNLETTVSPLVKARTTGEWVFHVAVPLKDKYGTFKGVLAQQIQASDIAKDLSKYMDAGKSMQMVSQSPESGLFFAYPLHLLSASGSEQITTPYADFARRSISSQDAFTWSPADTPQMRQTLVGYAQSKPSGLLTTIEQPVSDLWISFFLENMGLLSISGAALVLITGIYLHLQRVSNRLSEALHDAFFDALTKIPNRRAFVDMYPRLLRDAMRSQEYLSVLFIDIDHFKNFNDDYGHDGGDIALKAVAQTLHACGRRPLDFVCRWGGEEFIAILPRTSKAAATALAQKMLNAVRDLQLHQENGKPMRGVSVSIGITSSLITSKQQGEDLIYEADSSMRQAKQAGRDIYAVYPPQYA